MISSAHLAVKIRKKIKCLNIKRILLVPERGDPHGLLAEGLGGARPPIAYIPNDGWEWEEGPCTEEYPLGRALILAWDGEPVWQGIEVMDRLLLSNLTTQLVIPALRFGDRDLNGGSLPGTVIQIDADGQEVKNE